MTAVEVFESITNGGASDFAAAVKILDASGPWCLIGGLAVNCYAEPVYTVDADIVVASGNVADVRARFEHAGFRVEAFEHSLNARKPDSNLHLQLTQDARYQPFIERAKRQSVLGCSVPVATLDDLVQGKVWAWQDQTRRPTKRKKDELDLMRIAEAHPEQRAAIPAELAAQLERQK
jgi:hypothetical protein